MGPGDYRLMPWKNGLGTTTEIAIHPAEADLAGQPFDWRVSMADVTTDGEFSRFPGYDRSILHGGRVRAWSWISMRRPRSGSPIAVP